jgi:poly-gamma-glutamate capsule biosynthesis protein CapA/YwtB (metallophosphatase superfamily)
LYSGTGSIKKIGPSLKANESLVKILSYGKFHLVTLANNHLMDFGVEGLKSTMKICKEENVEFVGAGFNLQEARKPFYKTIKGKRIAVLNIAENEFSTTKNEVPGANPLDPVANYYDIKQARNNADFVFVIVHGGHEYYQYPSPRMQETYRFFIDAGADSVIGHHTHCYSGYEIYKGKSIFYSLGNFIFDWPGKYDSIWNEGYAVQFTIYDDSINFLLHPFIQGDREPGVRMMNKSERKIFDENLAQLNLQISDSKKIESKFQEFLHSRKKDYLSFIEPYSNKYLLGLFDKGLLPSLISRQKRRTILNLVRCEAHRDILIQALNH